MKKNGKRVIMSLIVALMLGTSLGHAQSFSYNNNYDSYYNNYLGNLFSNAIIRYRPSWPNNQVSNNKPSNPVPDTKPSKPVPDTKPSNPVPDTKPSNPVPDTKPDTNSSIELEVVRLVNIERQRVGLSPFIHSAELSRVARVKSQDMADKNYFSHNSPTYGDPFAMMRSFGIQYRTAGENIAKGYSSAQSVVKGWMNSSGHRENILSPSFGKIGVGYVNARGSTYWTQMFTD